VLERFQDRAREVAVFLQQHGGRKISRRGVDGVAEQQELNYRNHHDHGERNAVAPKLDEFLDYHRVAAPPEAEARLRNFVSMVRRVRHAHWKLSFERVINSMNTSSSDVSPCCQCNSLWSRQGAMVASSAARSRPDTCRLVPNGATMSTPGLPVSWSWSVCRP